jgi:hypothetical protein
MRRLFRRAAQALLAAAALGLARPAAAQPAPAEPRPALSPAAATDLLTPPALPEAWSRPAKPKHVKPANKGEFASEGVVRPPPAAAAPRDDRQPYTTRGVAYFEEDPPAPLLPAPAVAPAVLKQRVESACGRRAHGVQVMPRGDGGLTVRVFIADEAAREAVVERVLRLPEMQGPSIRLDIAVEK